MALLHGSISSHGRETARETCHDALVVVVGDFHGAPSLVDLVNRLGLAVTVYCRGQASAATALGRRLVVQRAVSRLRRLIPDEFTTAYVFNTRRAEGQWLMHRARRAGAHCILLDDGISTLACPSAHTIPRLLFAYGTPGRRLLGRIWYGSWWNDVREFRDHPGVDSVESLLPGGSEGSRDPARPFGLRLLGVLRSNPVLRRLSELSVADDRLPREGAVVLLLPPRASLRQDSAYRHRLVAIVGSILEQIERAVLKPHILERDLALWERDLGIGRERIVGTATAAEFVFATARDSIACVIGDISTALFSARALLRQEARVISLCAVTGTAESHRGIAAAYLREGIAVPADLPAVLSDVVDSA